MTPPVFLTPVSHLDDVETGDVVRLSGPEGRHAVSSLRLCVGERVDLVDGVGRRAEGTLQTSIGREDADIRVDVLTVEPRPDPWFTVVQALPKGERGELAVELLTEIGVDVIIPWAARNCVTQWRGDRADRGLRKWNDAVRAAAKQSRRSWFPVVESLHNTNQVAARVAEASLALVLDESADASIVNVELPEHGEILLVVGPEGGLADEERAVLSAAGARTTVIGPTVLRTSSAGLAAMAALLPRTSRWRPQAGDAPSKQTGIPTPSGEG